jgi:cell division protein FtsI (penicillin-binding protein 3)
MIRDKRIALLHASLTLFAFGIVAKAAKEQLWSHRKWMGRAEQQQVATANLPAPRGAILDVTGMTLAESHVALKVGVAPREVRDARKLARTLKRAGVEPAMLRRVSDTSHAWVDLPKPFAQSEISDILRTRGVYVSDVGQRLYLASSGIRRIVGRATRDGGGLDGIELTLDSLLRGEGGRSTRLRDATGRRFASPEGDNEEPRAGHTVVLTINRALQDIADRALEDAVAKMSASGGDIVVMNPQTGDLLAMASVRRKSFGTAATAFTEPYEPGSTLKPFIAGVLLARGQARADEVIETYNGVYVTNGRTLKDVHPAPRLSLADVIRFSSNIGITRFAERMSPREEYETLRDFGFGTPTGVPYPVESPGTLRPPAQWSKQSPASLAIGYEIAVTPLQLVTAYASIANGGELLQPALIKEIRAPDGTVIYRSRRKVVRRVLPPAVAAQLRDMLKDVVTRGTATEADLATFEVAGKSGTARRTQGRHYGAGSYTASFVGLFPAENPQYVILVKLDNPQTSIFGGKAAAPVSKVVLEAAVAARDAALDRGSLERRKVQPVFTAADPEDSAARARLRADPATTITVASSGELPPDTTDDLSATSVPFLVNLAEPPRVAVEPIHVRPVPSVRGMPLRSAVKLLHASGFRVQVSPGEEGTTAPVAGTPLRTGSLVRLYQR